MAQKVEVFLTDGEPIRLKVPWETFIKFARESLSQSLGKELAFDEDSFVKVISHEGEIRTRDLPEYVYLVIKESHDDPNH